MGKITPLAEKYCAAWHEPAEAARLSLPDNPGAENGSYQDPTAMAFYVRPENRGGTAAVKLLKRLGFQVSGGNYLQVLESNITAAKDTI
jgi:ribosomal protein S18 acetylase RimI-like enzyme